MTTTYQEVKVSGGQLITLANREVRGPLLVLCKPTEDYEFDMIVRVVRDGTGGARRFAFARRFPSAKDAREFFDSIPSDARPRP